MRVLFAGGGTGGHVYPALAVAQHLRATRPDFEALFLGTAHGLESRIVPAAGFALRRIPGRGVRRVGLVARARAVAALTGGCLAALRVVASWRPDVVLATGGYASLAGGLAAALWGRPLVVQEQNRIPGFTNRILARVAREVHVGFPGSEGRFPHPRRVRVTGNPVRPAFLELGTAATAEAAARSPTVLVLGGSRGARSINQAVADAIPRLATARRVDWIWQTGDADGDRWRAAAGAHVEVCPYIENVVAAYRRATLVLARSGAMTLAEITAAGKPAILVPFPGAVDDHQTANARVLVDAGAALLVPDRELSGARLAADLLALLEQPRRLQEMARASRALARPRATEDLAAAVVRAAGVASP